MPTNTYGPNDNYNELNSHFLPALIRKVHEIKQNKKKNYASTLKNLLAKTNYGKKNSSNEEHSCNYPSKNGFKTIARENAEKIIWIFTYRMVNS